jgi:ribosomal protein S18 acetylase RimI-like enzyme
METQRLSGEEALRRLSLSNLFSLWESVGKANEALEIHRGFRKIYNHGSSWPNRIWLTEGEDEECARSALENATRVLTRENEPILLVLTERQATFAGDWLNEQGLSLLFAQTGMVLELERASGPPTEGVLEIATVKTPVESSLWSQVASEAFGYRVDPDVVRNVLDLPEITLYLGHLPEGVAGTALLCTHHQVAGFHMAGTRPEHRREGVARQMMEHLIGEARARGLRHATLQASAMGEPLYSQLGFRKQFLLHNYLFSIR